jgi:hypothetical protein
MIDRISAAGVLVSEIGLQAIDVATSTLEREVSEDVIERTVLEHQHDHVVDLLEVCVAGLLSHV